jgi:hypothetical protein
MNEEIHVEIERITQGRHLRQPSNNANEEAGAKRSLSPLSKDEMLNLGKHKYGHDKSDNRHCTDCVVCRTDHFGIPRDWEEKARQQRILLTESKKKKASQVSYLNEAAHHLTHELVLEELESIRLLRLLKK